MPEITVNESLYELIKNRSETAGKSIEDFLAGACLADDAVTGHSLVELAADGVVTVNWQGIITHFNPGAERLFGYKAEEVLNQPLTMLIAESLRELHDRHVQNFVGGPGHSRYMGDRQEVQGLRKDGSSFYADISLVKYNGGVTAIIRDVTPLVEMIQVLSEQQYYLRLMTENATDLICLHAPDGTYIYVSPVSLKMSGYAPEELLGKNPYDNFHPDDFHLINQSHEEALEGQTPVITYRFRCKDGSYIWLETTTEPVFNEAGEVQNMVTVSRNVTQQREMQSQLEQERNLLRLIMETSPSGINVVNARGEIEFANRRSSEILGMPKERVTELSYDASEWRHTDYDGNPWPDEKQPFVRVMQTKAPVWDVRHAIEWPDGQRVYLAINGAPILDENGEVSRVVFTIEDYTERKLQQDQIEAALERERSLNELKSAFISMVSHEFRTPMAIIKTSTSILRSRFDQMTPETIKQRIDKIDRQIDRLDDLISDVTFMNKADRVGVNVTLEPLDVNSFFTQLISEMEMAYPNTAPIHLDATQDCASIQADIALMQQIFTNLISNAMKYNEKPGSVHLSYECDGTWLTVTISDRGIGIPEDEQANLFDAFYRGRNVGARQGTGLGLSIVDNAVKAMGGTISLSSQVEEGSVFTVRLPIVSQN